MKIIKEGTRAVRDILSTYYHCHNCGCVFSLEEKDLEWPGPGEEYGHVSDPMRYQSCPTCGREIAIYDRKNWKPSPKAQRSDVLPEKSTSPSTQTITPSSDFVTDEAGVEYHLTEYQKCMRENDDQRAQLDCIGLPGTPNRWKTHNKPVSKYTGGYEEPIQRA